MQAIAISPADHSGATDLLDARHRLLARIFQGRLEWDVNVRQGKELDAFRPTYILSVTASLEVVGCARLLPATARP